MYPSIIISLYVEIMSEHSSFGISTIKKLSSRKVILELNILHIIKFKSLNKHLFF